MLLPPDGRTLLSDVLRPPPGFRLDRAVATTFMAGVEAIPVTLKRLASDIELPSVPDAVRWTAPAEGRVDEEEIEFSWAGETARHIGTVTHRWLQRMAEDELRGWDVRRIESSKNLFGRELHRRHAGETR